MDDMRGWIDELKEKGVHGLTLPNPADPDDIDRWIREYYWARDYAKQAEAKKALMARQAFEASAAYDWDADAMDLRNAVIYLGDEEFAEQCKGFEFLNDLSREDLTDLCINALSLCPIHLVDWAICFDDCPPDCAQIRLIYPNSHDT